MNRRLLYRIVNGAVMAPVFALSVIVQLNDPDPFWWCVIYGAAFALCVAAALNKRPLIPALIVGGVATVWAATHVPSLVTYVRSDHAPTTFYMHTGDILEEEARECGGLLIDAAWCFVIAAVSRRSKQNGPA